MLRLALGGLGAAFLAGGGMAGYALVTGGWRWGVAAVALLGLSTGVEFIVTAIRGGRPAVPEWLMGFFR